MNQQETVSSDQVPYLFREPSIMTGYSLPNQSLMYYIKSLFQIHNESFNIWSHLIGCGIVIYKIIGYFQEFNIYTDYVLTTLLIFGIASFMELFASATAHLLCAKSANMHYLILMFDFMGCSFGGLGGDIYGFYGLSDSGFYRHMEDYYLPIMAILTYCNFLGMCAGKLIWGHCPNSKKKRIVVISGNCVQFLYGVLPTVPIFPTCYADPNCSMVSLLNPLLVFLLYVLAAVTFAAHQPEKTWPGKFDILGHGHQIFHVILIVLMWTQFDGINEFHHNRLVQHSNPSLQGLLCIVSIIFSLEVMTVAYLSRYIPAVPVKTD